jgi:alanyl-tRNA synthetase
MEQIGEIERTVNEIISMNLAVTEEHIPQGEASAFLDLSKLPANTPDTIRVVRIGNYDACACIGPHVENTNQVGVFNIISHSYHDGVLRLRFKLNRPNQQ